MKRLAISLLSLGLAAVAALTDVRPLNAAPPPPCPDGETFQFCEYTCPTFLATYCLSMAGHPANCHVASSSCLAVGGFGTDCFGNVVLPENPGDPMPMVKDKSIFCTYAEGN